MLEDPIVKITASTQPRKLDLKFHGYSTRDITQYDSGQRIHGFQKSITAIVNNQIRNRISRAAAIIDLVEEESVAETSAGAKQHGNRMVRDIQASSWLQNWEST
jgi:hypothetical protein